MLEARDPVSSIIGVMIFGFEISLLMTSGGGVDIRLLRMASSYSSSRLSSGSSLAVFFSCAACNFLRRAVCPKNPNYSGEGKGIEGEGARKGWHAGEGRREGRDAGGRGKGCMLGLSQTVTSVWNVGLATKEDSSRPLQKLRLHSR